MLLRRFRSQLSRSYVKCAGTIAECGVRAHIVSRLKSGKKVHSVHQSNGWKTLKNSMSTGAGNGKSSKNVSAGRGAACAC